MDPITLEVISSSLLAYADEMNNNFWRTSYSFMNYEMRDFAVWIVDPSGKIIIQSKFTHPAFTADLGFVVKAAVDKIGDEGIDEEDIILSNDPNSQGQHLNNVVVFTPLFVNGKIFAFPCLRAHWHDVGGGFIESGSTSSTEIFQEGIQLNAIKVYRKNLPNRDILRIIEQNTRFPDLVLGDLNAQIAACKLGLRRLAELLKKFGQEQVREAIQKTWDMSEETARKGVRSIPSGEYRAEAFLDNDGAEFDRPVKVSARVEVSGDRMIIDFSDMSDQVKGSINSGFFGGATNAARIAFKCLTTPLLPSNEGCFRPLEVVCPQGKLLNARSPAAMGDWSVPFPTVIDTILKALAGAVPDRIPAATRGDPRGIGFSGFDPVKRKYFSIHVPPIGGHGARPLRDGPAPRCAIQQGDEHMVPVEVSEIKSPIVFEKFELCPDSGGAGKFRGGMGVDGVVHLLTDGFLRNKMIRSLCPPWGFQGGGNGTANRAFVLQPDGTTEKVPRVENYPLPAGRRVRLLTGGGGGYGDPLERPPEVVRMDVKNGYISLESAERDYGVFFHSSDLEVDEKATVRFRNERRKERNK